MGGDNIAGGKLKEAGLTHWLDPNTGATNDSGFTALPGGYRSGDSDGTFGSIGCNGSWWSTTESSIFNAWDRNILCYGGYVKRYEHSKKVGFSVRCIQGETPIIPKIPTLFTTAISGIIETSAFSGGNITSDGGATVTFKGVCWSTSTSPTTTNSKTNDGKGTGIFNSTISGLSAGTTYYVRAYATNSAGTAYGNEFSFTTLANLPTLTTNTDICTNSTSVSSGGTVQSDGGTTVTARGVCWNTTPSPTTSNTKTTDGSGLGSFTSTIFGLTPGTTYYLRAYSINAAGSAYGNEVSFTTTPTSSFNCGTVTDIDGNVYHTVTIGTQCWMVENLRTTKYRNGDPIPNVTDNAAWVGLTSDGYCWWNNDASTYKPIYGALYNWYAVSDVRNIAPAGWHVSSDDEWKLMEIYLDVTSAITNPNGWEGTDVSGKLKETCFTYWPSPNEGASNSSGFTALPGGFRRDGGAFFTFGVDGLFWTSTEADVSRAWYRRLFYGYANVFRNQDEKWGGFSVRCVRD